jgi:hydrogenase expression/formation protein HypE
MAHGGSGSATVRLLDTVFLPHFDHPELRRLHDGAILPATPGPLAFTTDSHVVHPLEFPGGDIAQLAVFGTANDLAMCGAEPRWLSAAFILEEGFSQKTLARLAGSLARAAREAGMDLVAADTKVVEHGKGDGLYISTSGIGIVRAPQPVGPQSIRPGDVVIVSGDIGRHGIAIMAAREDSGFDTSLESDCAPVWPAVKALLDAGIPIHALRDCTRGGLATVLIELAEASSTTITLRDTAIPISAPVRAACEILGLDPLYTACEGRFVAILPEEYANRALSVLGGVDISSGACQIGRVEPARTGTHLQLSQSFGTLRALDRLSGVQLPRIC